MQRNLQRFQVDFRVGRGEQRHLIAISLFPSILGEPSTQRNLRLGESGARHQQPKRRHREQQYYRQSKAAA